MKHIKLFENFLNEAKGSALEDSKKFKDSDTVFIQTSYMGDDEDEDEEYQMQPYMKKHKITWKWLNTSGGPRYESAEFKGKKGALLAMFDKFYGGYANNIENEYEEGSMDNIFTKKSHA
jgi:hypothetical protein